MLLSDILPKENIVDKEATWKTAPGIEIDVIVKDAKLNASDKLLFLIEPKAGTGAAWLSASQIKFKESDK